MASLTTTAIYKDGVVIPKIKPSYFPEEVLVIFVEPKSDIGIKKQNIARMQEQDEQVWQKAESKYRKIRAKLSRKKFPGLYD